jgi:uncharacterized protein (TIGR03435 family)
MRAKNRIVLAALTAHVAVGIIVVGIINAPAIRAQPAPSPKFEVASIRPCEDGDFAGRSAGGPGSGSPASSSPGRLTVPCRTVKRLIERAYLEFADGRVHVWPEQISIEGGPAWINSGSYRIEAKAEGPQSRGTMNGPMLQALLEDRFKLKLHRATREVPVYALTVVKGGPKLQPFREGSCHPFNFDNLPHPPEPGQPDPLLCGISEVTAKGYDLYRTTMAEFSREFSARLDRPVIDKTGIAGMFNIHLELSVTDLGYPADPRSSDPAAPAAPADPSSVFDAVRTAVQKLGLKLDQAKGPGEFLVIDSVERPSEN